MFVRVCFTFLIAGLFSVTFATAQAPPPTPAKANARPTPTPAPPAIEPFDKADVKTMASKCVTLDTEAGSIVLEGGSDELGRRLGRLDIADTRLRIPFQFAKCYADALAVRLTRTLIAAY